MIAQIAFFCAALVAASAYAPLVNTGVSTSSRQQDIRSRRWLRKQEGILHTLLTSTVGARRVDYVADGHGFRATVKTNEPGTAASAPAAALIASPYAGPVAPVVNHIAPAAPAVAVAAPVAYGAGALRSWTWSRRWFGIWSWCPWFGIWSWCPRSRTWSRPWFGIRSWRLWCWTWQGYPGCDLIHLKNNCIVTNLDMVDYLL
ncbi:hypothetical protein CEXT_436631 [Caerostris extrusa]|uniref:Uncharacterized protein n=1 Tax=Caerostris extrusa TaxID=172846 RepID=A0AAV4WLG4_CAEEX|nr:hypothetical protein CEXT_436631 [Caerostris extrusa]